MIAAKYLKRLTIRTGSIIDAVIKKDNSKVQFNLSQKFSKAFYDSLIKVKFF